MAGGDWPALARTALVLLRDKGDTDEEETKIQLLAACREIPQAWKRDHISSKDLIDELVNRECETWAVWWKKEIDAGNTKGPAARLAKLLKPFGIIPRSPGSRTAPSQKAIPVRPLTKPCPLSS
jgi:hypothetical protein